MSLTLENWNDVSKLKFKNKDTFKILDAIPVKALIDDGSPYPILVTYRVDDQFNCSAFYSIDGVSASNGLQILSDHQIILKEDGTNIQNTIIFMIKNNIMFVYSNVWYTISGVDFKSKFVFVGAGTLSFSKMQNANVYYSFKIIPFTELVNEVEKSNLDYSEIINWNDNDNP